MQSLHREATAQRHNEQLLNFTDDIDTILIGDSVFERFVWFLKAEFKKNVLVLAKGGDTISHLLWRLDNTPNSNKITKIILHIGQNNISNKKTKASAIADGIKKTVDLLTVKFPNASILFIDLYYQKNVDKSKTDDVNHLTEIALGSKFVSSFWKSMLPDGYDNTKYEDDVHLNMESYKRFYQLIMKLI